MNYKRRNIKLYFNTLVFGFILRFLLIIMPGKKCRRILRKMVLTHDSAKAALHYKKILKKIRTKTKFRVVFFVLHESVWQYDPIYKIMKKDSRFDPVIVVIPYTVYGKENMLRDMTACYEYFKGHKYNVTRSYNPDTDKYLDVKENINPDIIFFTNPHKLTKKRYSINYWAKHTLTCYSPYAYEASNLYQEQYNQKFHNIVWRYYQPHAVHKILSTKYAANKGKNTVVVGYPRDDFLLDKKNTPQDLWKKQDKLKKRIIWSPHQTLDEEESGLGFSCFLFSHKIMLDLADKFHDEVQLLMKPHPLLKIKLYNHKDWGRKRTDDYFKAWRDKENCQINEGDFVDLFLTSDAIISSSLSFVVEYLYVNKPALFNLRNQNIPSKFNELGRLCYSHWYKATSYDDLESFISDIVIAGNDFKRDKRSNFVKQNLLPPNWKTASENIMQNLLDDIVE